MRRELSIAGDILPDLVCPAQRTAKPWTVGYRATPFLSRLLENHQHCERSPADRHTSVVLQRLERLYVGVTTAAGNSAPAIHNVAISQRRLTRDKLSAA